MVIRYEGPRGGPGMQEMLAPTSAIVGRGWRERRPDHRRPIQRWHDGACIGHVSPEAAAGGPIALVEQGDIIEIDIPGRTVRLLVDDRELKRRRDAWQPSKAAVHSGWLARYAAQVTSADTGAVLRGNPT